MYQDVVLLKAGLILKTMSQMQQYKLLYITYVIIIFFTFQESVHSCTKYFKTSYPYPRWNDTSSWVRFQTKEKTGPLDPAFIVLTFIFFYGAL
jgi:Na+(H+)/acetate symporter ActP